MRRLRNPYIIGCLLLLTSFAATLVLYTMSASAQFNANLLIDDQQFDATNTMSASQIDTFLNNNFGSTSCISTAHGFAAPDVTGYLASQSGNTTGGFSYGSDVSAGTIIYHAAHVYGLNPQVILTTLEKEESLVSGGSGCSVWRYTAAMGNGCPDSVTSNDYSGFELYSINGTAVTSVSGTCVNSAGKAGFSRQVITGSWLLKYSEQRSKGNTAWNVQLTDYPYTGDVWDNSNDPPSTYYGYMTQGVWALYNGGPTSYYDGHATIDSTDVYMSDGATASLYTYTPHLHGNELFDSIFEQWFGLSVGEGYTFATSYDDNGDPRQWVVYHGEKHYVTADMVYAYNLGTPVQWSGTYLGSYVDGSDLTRLMRPTGTLNVYLVADGKRYLIPNTGMMDIWNISNIPVSDVATGLYDVPSDYGTLSFTSQLSGNPAVNLMDSGLKRHILDGNLLNGFYSDSPSVSVFTATSDSFYSNLGTGGDIGNPKIADGSSNIYILDSGRKLQLDSVMNQLYPGTASSVTPALYGYFGTKPMTYLIRAWNSPDVYLIDQGTKHHVVDPNVLAAWQSSTYPSSVTVTSMGLRDFMSSGADISDYFLSYAGNDYMIDGYQHKIPASLQSAYAGTRTVYAASSSLYSVFPVGSQTTGLIQGSSPSVYMLSNSGSKYLLMSPNLLSLWNDGGGVTTLRDANLSRYGGTGSIGAFVTDGAGNNYIIESGQKHPIDATTQSNWNLVTPDTLSDGTLGRLTTGSSIVNKVQNGGSYFMISKGAAYATTDFNIADMWGLTDAPTMNPAIVTQFFQPGMLTRIARSNVSGDSRLFIENKGKLYRLYPNTATLLNASGPLTYVNPNAFTVADWTAYVVQDEAGKYYAIDNGQKRSLPAGPIRDQWTYGNAAAVPIMGNGFLNTLPTGIQMERAIKSASSPNIYAAVNFDKSWIQSWTTYSNDYAPYTIVSDTLLGLMPNGGNIN